MAGGGFPDRTAPRADIVWEGGKLYAVERKDEQLNEELNEAYIPRRCIILGRISSTVGVASDDNDFGSQPRAIHGFKRSAKCRFNRVAVMRVCVKDPLTPSGYRRANRCVSKDDSPL